MIVSKHTHPTWKKTWQPQWVRDWESKILICATPSKDWNDVSLSTNDKASIFEFIKYGRPKARDFMITLIDACDSSKCVSSYLLDNDLEKQPIVMNILIMFADVIKTFAPYSDRHNLNSLILPIAAPWKKNSTRRAGIPAPLKELGALIRSALHYSFMR